MFEKIFRNKTILAVVSIAFGIYMIIAGRGVIDTIVRVAGYALLATAAAYLLTYFFGGSHKDGVQLGYAALAALAGILVIRFAPFIVNWFPRMVGIVLAVMGISNLMQAMQGEYPVYSKITPVIIIILGVIIFFHPGAILNAAVVLAGIALILNGVSELDLIRRVR